MSEAGVRSIMLFGVLVATRALLVYRCNIPIERFQEVVDRPDIDIWTEGARETIDVAVQSSDAVAQYSCDYVRTEYEERKLLARSAKQKDFYEAFPSYDEIMNKIKQFAEHPTVEMGSVGRSIEGRDIPFVKLGAPGGNKTAVWLNGGQHAREWISSPTVLYLVEQLIQSDFLEHFDIYATPMQNPDGYEYSRTPGNRFWRKNRRDNGDGTFGVDLNRNWDDHWAETGSSSNTGSNTYHGTAPFSEPETRLTSEFVLQIPNLYGAIDFHSYGQLLLRNWGWTRAPSRNEQVLKELGQQFVDAMRTHDGTNYQNIRGAELYPAAGATDDWVTNATNAVAFTLELRNTSSFQIPASEILESGKEVWLGVQRFLQFLKENPDIPPNQE